jgi:hypothetical protein
MQRLLFHVDICVVSYGRSHVVIGTLKRLPKMALLYLASERM